MDDDFDDAEFLALATAVERRSAQPSTSTSNTVSQPTPQALPSTTPAKIVQPTPKALPQRSGPSSILVSTRQKGNPILTHISALPWEYTDTPADYVLGSTTCALFLSLKYHRLHPEYIYTRISSLKGKYQLRVLLTMVDIENHEDPLKELSKTSLVNNLTLILAWSAKEAAGYLERFKSLEFAQPTGIRGFQATSYADRMTEFVTAPRGVNKADALGLVSKFGSVKGAVNARIEEVATVSGWGEKKCKRWVGVVQEPFRSGKRKPEEDVTRPTPTVAPRAAVQARTEPDEDEAMLAAMAEAESRAVGSSAIASSASTSNSKRPRASEPELSDGVKAALAKFNQLYDT